MVPSRFFLKAGEEGEEGHALHVLSYLIAPLDLESGPTSTSSTTCSTIDPSPLQLIHCYRHTIHHHSTTVVLTTKIRFQRSSSKMPPMVPQRGGPSGLRRPGMVSGKTIFGAGKTGGKRHRYVHAHRPSKRTHGSHQTTFLPITLVRPGRRVGCILTHPIGRSSRTTFVESVCFWVVFLVCLFLDEISLTCLVSLVCSSS